MSENIVETITEGRIRLIYLNNPPENRLNGPLVSELISALEKAESDPDTAGIVLTGRPEKVFSAGYDLEWMMKNLNEGDTVDRFMDDMATLLRSIALFAKPVVAAVNGHAIGEGAFLAGCCDFRVMREDRGWLQFPEVHINMPFVPGQLAILRSILSPAAIRDMTLFGRRYAATDAAAIGFIDQYCPLEDIMPEAIKVAEELARGNPAAFSKIKKDMRAPMARIFEEEDPPVVRAMLNSFRGK